MQFYPPISNLVTMEMYETTFILLTPLCTLRANVHLLIRLYFLRNILLFSQIANANCKLHDDVILLLRPECFSLFLSYLNFRNPAKSRLICSELLRNSVGQMKTFPVMRVSFHFAHP